MRSVFVLSFLFLLMQDNISIAQNSATPPSKHKIAIFAPLFLDSAFDAGYNYRYGKTFPKFINPGLEFYEGAQLALDSMQEEGMALEVFVYDTRSANKTLTQQLNSPEMDSVELLIVHTTAKELISFAEFAAKKKVPVINANLPFDGGVTANPYLVLLNSTLKTHCKGIYQYLQKYYSTKKLVVFRKKGVMEDMIRDHLNDFGKITASVPLKLKYVDLKDNFTEADLIPWLDSLNTTIVIAGSLDENFGRQLCKQLASLNKKFPVSVIGMPTWDGIRDFSNTEYKGLEIIFSTPFYNQMADQVSISLIEYFNTRMYSRPSDMVFRGYETTWRFAKLLNLYKKDFHSNITRKEFNIFHDFDIQPVFTNHQNMTLDYFENKKLYFIKKIDGVIRSVN